MALISGGGGPNKATLAAPIAADDKATAFKFVAGYAALWVILTLGADIASTADAAAALAVAVALTASVMYIPQAATNLGFLQ